MIHPVHSSVRFMIFRSSFDFSKGNKFKEYLKIVICFAYFFVVVVESIAPELIPVLDLVFAAFNLCYFHSW